MKRIAFCLMVYSFILAPSEGQYYKIIRDDTLRFEKDSAILSVENIYGDIAWQVSYDSVTWTTISADGNELIIWIDSVASYRAISLSGNCPVVSDTICAGLEKMPVNNDFSLKTEAKIYQLPSGIFLKTNSMSVQKEIDIHFEEYDSISATELLPFPALSGKLFVKAFDFNASEINLIKPVKIQIPASNLSPGCLPRVFQLDKITGEWEIKRTNLIYDTERGFIEFRITNLNPLLVLLSENVLMSQQALPGQGKNDSSMDETGTEGKCLRKIVRVVSGMLDIENAKMNDKDDCFFIQDSGRVTFPDCPEAPYQSWNFREIGKSCIPGVDITIDGLPDKELIRVGDEISLTFFTYIKTETRKNPLADQFISLVLPEGLSGSELSGNTGKDGKKTFYLKACAKNLDAVIDYLVDFRYCLETIKATDGVNYENNCKNETYKPKEGFRKVSIYDYCTKRNEIDCSESGDSNCEKIKAELNVEGEDIDIALFPGDMVLNFKEDSRIIPSVDNHFIIDDPMYDITWSSSDPGLVDVNEIGEIRSNASVGTAIITARLCDAEAISTVEVRNITCDSAKVRIPIRNIYLKEHSRYPIQVIFDSTAEKELYVPKLEFTSNNENIVTVDWDGIVRGVGPGQTTISVSWCDSQVLVNIEVVALDFCEKADIEVDTHPLYMNTDAQYKILIDHYAFADGIIYAPVFSFMSSDTTVAKVNGNGVITPMAPGEVTIHVKWCDQERTIPLIVSDEYVYQAFSMNYRSTMHCYGIREYNGGTSSFQADDFTSVSASYISRRKNDELMSDRLRETSGYYRSTFFAGITDVPCNDGTSGVTYTKGTTYNVERCTNCYVALLKKIDEHKALFITPSVIGPVHYIHNSSTTNIYCSGISSIIPDDNSGIAFSQFFPYFECDMYSADGENFFGSRTKYIQDGCADYPAIRIKSVSVSYVKIGSFQAK